MYKIQKMRGKKQKEKKGDRNMCQLMDAPNFAQCQTMTWETW